MAHTDLEVPDFSFYRRPSNASPTVPSTESHANRHAFSYFMSGSYAVVGLYAAKKVGSEVG